ncbi:facilitated trehalose transporter Tret1-like [Achroia grisella]|uniref:facilitated trehalose transporter Tret1-like n=1 Tax=Achroia grisella TaxID=688607 RepID=UPI0027D2094D|nr:facilitated trehalose transporter Tret1-like [Achroia grisella]
MANKYFLRQSFIAFGFITHGFCAGMAIVFISSLNLALLSPDATEIRATPDQTSWLASCNTITGLIGYFTIPPIMQKYGRRVINIGTAVIYSIGWLIYIFANNILTLFIARLVHGICLGAIYINCVIASEYSDPKRRGYLVAIKKMFSLIGAFSCHALVLCWTWRQIAIFAIFPNLLIIINGFYWPESPSYLAMVGRFEECKYSFYWLHGKSVEKQNELKILMAAQTERILKHNRNNCTSPIELLYAFRDKVFLKASLVMSVLIFAVDVSGRLYLFTYVIQIMRELVTDEAIAGYCTLIVDLFTITGSIISVFVIHKLKRRTALLFSGILTAILMLSTSLLIFLKEQYKIQSSLTWIILSIVMLQNFVSYIGFIPVTYNIAGEIFPLEYKGIGSSVTGISYMLFYFVTMKFTPFIIDGTGLQGMYLIYGICLLLCILVLYFILLETKDKTLQDIEDEIKGVKRSAIEMKPMLDGTVKLIA